METFHRRYRVKSCSPKDFYQTKRNGSEFKIASHNSFTTTMEYWVAAISEIAPGLFIGNSQCTYRRATLETNQITAIISAIAGPLALWSRTKFTDYIQPGHHLWIECMDSSTQDMLVHMSTVCDFIDANLQATAPSQSSGRVLVHCELGISRSSTLIVAYLMRTLHKSRDDVLAQLRLKWSRAKPNANFMAQLAIWEQVGYNVWMDEGKRTPKKEYQSYLTRRAGELQALGLTGNELGRPLSL